MELEDQSVEYSRPMILLRRLWFVWAFMFLSFPPGNQAYAQNASWATQKVIVLDPGHGGHDQGAVGPSGTTEKSVTLALAQRIKKSLGRPFAVHLTREGDYGMDTERRTAVANHHRGDLFISLHAGGSFQHKARGSAVFHYGSGTGQRLASQQDKIVSEGGPQPQSWNLVQTVHAKHSRLLATLAHRYLIERVSPVDRGIHQAPCLVLKGADMPAILVEIGHVSHPAEENQLDDPAVVSALANAIGQGIKDFLEQTSGCVNEKGVIIEEDIGPGRGAAW